MASPSDRGPLGRHWRHAALGLIALVAWKALDDAARQHLFLINRTPSLPNWAFLVERDRLPERGDTVFFAPPPGLLVRRHFGAHPSAFGKIVYGMPGDTVEHIGARVFVRSGGGQAPGRYVASLKPATRLGEALEAGPVGRIPAGCYYAGSPHKDGFDSRYAAIGFVCRDRILGTAQASIL